MLRVEIEVDGHGGSMPIYLAVLVLFAYVWLLTEIFPKIAHVWKWQKEYRFRRLLGKIREELSKFGILFVYNERGETLGICRKVHFDDALKNFSPKTQSPWKKLVVKVRPTYTFVRSEEDRLIVHTGDSSDFEKMARSLLSELLFGKYQEKLLSWQLLREIIKVIARQDPRLYVPFTSETNWEKDKEEFMYVPEEAHYALVKMTLDDLYKSNLL